ncbi:hypothetical protein ACFQY4_46080 [Catellatospora bangladeshensis]|uniref:Uncharacterized protein n=1 Tax=Catellatospora bangladeshensis TaxID=310355 RepID=A0A8J3JT07_9ACTN|nr:hypothetical protein [Catellatospora bangladeshensis]GIF86491.1 hypothetical protein Cba03nite_78400 [Catellatospora bangladeshensis]
MSEQPCGQCPVLHAEISRQAAVIARLNTWIAWLRERLGGLRAAVSAAEALMREQAEQPTMPRSRLLTQLHERLINALIDVERR